MKKLLMLIMAVGMYVATVPPVPAQDQPTPTQQPAAEELEKEKAEREKNAYRLLDQVIDEAQSLRLTENRVRVQISAADMLWDNNQGRARTLFAMAAEGVAELGRNTQPVNNRRSGPQNNVDRRSFQLRQELVLAAARHDAALAYQLLASTKPAVPQNTVDPRNPRTQMTADDSLEQTLLGRIAALDPKLAAQNAEQMIDKGQFPRTLSQVLNELHKQDPEAATKLADKTVKKLQATNLLTNNEAGALVQSLLMPGPRVAQPAATTTSTPTSGPNFGRTAVLEQSAYVELLGSVVDLALKATVPAQNLQRTPAQRARPQGVGPNVGPGQNNSGPTEAQVEQMGARRLLGGLQAALPLIDQYLPAKSPLVRQKLSEMGLANTSPMNMAQTFNTLQGNPTADSLVQAAAVAPPQMQGRLYQQAAFKALEEGNVDRARQIATDYLQPNLRDRVMQRIEFREMAKKAEGARLEEIRQTIARLQSEDEKIDMLIQVARETEKANPKLSMQLLEEAKQMTTRRATSYQHFEQQLKVARAFAAIDPARSFEVLDPAISHLNELLSAAAVLSGFEINVFRDGEMTIQGQSGLTATLNRFGEELAMLARTDFERSETLASRFQFAESRIMARLSIVQGLLGVRSTSSPTRVVFRN